MQKDFAYRGAFEYQLIKLEESGTLSRLREIWIHAREYSVDHLCMRTEADTKSGTHDQVVLKNVIEIFWLLLGGVAACAVVQAGGHRQ